MQGSNKSPSNNELFMGTTQRNQNKSKKRDKHREEQPANTASDRSSTTANFKQDKRPRSANEDEGNSEQQKATEAVEGLSPEKLPASTIELPLAEPLFPEKLLQMLYDAETNQFEDIISWGGDGKAFKIHNIKFFEEFILPKYFKMTKYKSFTRQLHNYGFVWVRSGPNKGGSAKGVKLSSIPATNLTTYDCFEHTLGYLPLYYTNITREDSNPDFIRKEEDKKKLPVIKEQVGKKPPNEEGFHSAMTKAEKDSPNDTLSHPAHSQQPSTDISLAVSKERDGVSPSSMFQGASSTSPSKSIFERQNALAFGKKNPFDRGLNYSSTILPGGHQDGTPNTMDQNKKRRLDIRSEGPRLETNTSIDLLAWQSQTILAQQIKSMETMGVGFLPAVNVSSRKSPTSRLFEERPPNSSDAMDNLEPRTIEEMMRQPERFIVSGIGDGQEKDEDGSSKKDEKNVTKGGKQDFTSDFNQFTRSDRNHPGGI